MLEPNPKTVVGAWIKKMEGLTGVHAGTEDARQASVI
jgi:hypothetical protein